MPVKCSVKGCPNPSRTLGLCHKHHMRMQRHGDPLVVLKTDKRTHPHGGDDCLVTGCSGGFYCHGLCRKHYQRWKRHGNPTYNKTEAQSDFIEKAIAYRGSKCLLWPFKSKKGQYPAATIDGEQRYVHRYVCERVHGLAPGFWSLHSCDNQACITPKHLRWGTHEENVSDKVKRGRVRNQFSKA